MASIATCVSCPQACIAPVDLRGERQPGVLLQRQRVHVGAQQHRRAGPRAVEDRDHRADRPAAVHLQREVRELGQHGVAGAGQRQPELGMAVQRPPQGHRARLQPPGLLAEPGEQGIGRTHAVDPGTPHDPGDRVTCLL